MYSDEEEDEISKKLRRQPPVLSGDIGDKSECFAHMENIKKALSTKQSNDIKGGFAAELHHAHAFNGDAAKKGLTSVRAEVLANKSATDIVVKDFSIPLPNMQLERTKINNPLLEHPIYDNGPLYKTMLNLEAKSIFKSVIDTAHVEDNFELLTNTQLKGLNINNPLFEHLAYDNGPFYKTMLELEAKSIIKSAKKTVRAEDPYIVQRIQSKVSKSAKYVDNAAKNKKYANHQILKNTDNKGGIGNPDISDKIEYKGAQSTPLTKKQVSDAEFQLECCKETNIRSLATVQQVLNGTSIQGALHAIKHASDVCKGRKSVEEGVQDTVKDTAVSGVYIGGTVVLAKGLAKCGGKAAKCAGPVAGIVVGSVVDVATSLITEGKVTTNTMKGVLRNIAVGGAISLLSCCIPFVGPLLIGGSVVHSIYY